MYRKDLITLDEYAINIHMKMLLLQRSAEIAEEVEQHDEEPSTSRLDPISKELNRIIKLFERDIMERIAYEYSRPTPKEMKESNEGD